MGAVYEARQEPLNRRVALKTLHAKSVADPELVARFFNEAKVLSSLEHPSIVQVSDFGHAADGMAYLVMEYLRGQSLGHRLRAGTGRLPLVAALQVAWQVAEVLAIAHAQGVVHRDLKPDNLMLVADPVAPSGERVKVLDFGIAKLLNQAEPGGIRTNTQAVMGTPMYMSPEQCAGAGRVDAKSDVYSLGCVLFQLLAGRPPFVAEGTGQLLGMHLYEEPPVLSALAPEVPADVCALVRGLLLKDSRQRPSMAEAAAALGSLLAPLGGAGSVIQAWRPSSAAGGTQAVHPPLAQKQSTTLGQSMGQLSKSKAGWRPLLWAGSVGVLLTAVAAMGWQAHSVSEPLRVPQVQGTATANARDSSEPRPIAPAPGAPAQVRWTVETVPSGATVCDENGNQLGKTPWTQEVLAHAGTVKLRVQNRGYQDETLEFDAGHETSRLLRMTRLSPEKSVRARLRATPKSPPPSPQSPIRKIYED
jgi:serine/threonine-protein kinase